MKKIDYKNSLKLLRNVIGFLAVIVSFDSYANDFPKQLVELEAELDSVSSSTLYLHNSNGVFDAPILDTTVDITISGIVSNVKFIQSFQNTSDEWVEGRYVFPLPDQAAVNSLTIRIGEREIVGTIREKQEAERQYQLAKEAGHVASLVKQHRPNLFSSKFANIAPGETISIELTYVQTVRYDTDRYSLRVPLTLTPRYSNQLVIDAAAISPNQVSLSDAQTQTDFSHGVTITTEIVGLYDNLEITSPSHQFSTSSVDGGTRLSLIDEAFLDRDFILEWHQPVIDVPAVQMWRETVEGEHYLLATIMPPNDINEIPDQARELILVIDTSGSMGGESIRAAKAALLDALTGLKPVDKFNIIEFDDQFRVLFDIPQPADATNLAVARKFTQGLVADGGTEMLGALRAALRYNASEHLRQVVFITDGSVGYEEAVFESIKNDLGDSRLFTVGIGSAPNEWFMRKVALAGRGTYHFINNIGSVETEMANLLRKLEAPALTDVVVSFNDSQVEVMPSPIPDLYANEPLVIAAKMSDSTHTMNVSGTWGLNEWSTSASVDGAPETSTGLSTVWAKQKIESLEDKQRYHSDPEFYRSLILRLALDHKLLSPYTAFLAVESEPVRPQAEPLAEKDVPNLLPAGSDMQSFNYPVGAAGKDTLLLVSMMLLLLAMVTAYSEKVARLFAVRS